MASFKSKRSRSALVSFCGFLYAIEWGFVLNEVINRWVNTGERYNWATNVFEVASSMIKARMEALTVSINRKIFVMGGFGNEFNCLSSCEVFDFKTNQLFLILPMRIPRSCFGIAVNAAEIICTGYL